MKRKFLLIVVVVMALVLLAACARNNEDVADPGQPEPGQPEPAQPEPGQQLTLSPDQPVTWNMMVISDNMPPADDNWIMAEIRDRLGVNLVFDIVPGDLQDTRIASMLAAGAELPDIIHVTQLDAHMVQAGALLRLDPLLDSGKFPRLYEHHKPYRGRLTFREGPVEEGLYQMAVWNRFYTDSEGGGPIMGPMHGGTGFWIQKSVLEFHDFPDLDNMNLERYFEMIEEYKAANPTIDGMPTIGFTFPMLGRVWGMTNPPQFLAGHPNNGEVIVEDGIARIYHTSDYAEYYWRTLNEAFHRGLVDPESWTRTHDEYQAALASGRVLGFHDQGWAFGTPRSSLIEAGRYNRTWVPTMPVMREGTTPWYADRPVLNVNQGIGIPVDSENPELKLLFFETLLDPEWQKLFMWGREGIDYHVDENNMFYRTPEQRRNADEAAWRLSNRLEVLWGAIPKIQGSLPDGNAYNPANQPSEFYAGLSDYFRFFLESYGKSTWTDFVNEPPSNPPYYPAWQAPIPGGTPAAEAAAQIQDILPRLVPNLISAPPGEFDARWAEFVAEFELVDIEALEAQIQLFIDDRLARAEQ